MKQKSNFTKLKLWDQFFYIEWLPRSDKLHGEMSWIFNDGSDFRKPQLKNGLKNLWIKPVRVIKLVNIGYCLVHWC